VEQTQLVLEERLCGLLLLKDMRREQMDRNISGRSKKDKHFTTPPRRAEAGSGAVQVWHNAMEMEAGLKDIRSDTLSGLVCTKRLVKRQLFSR
jgi:hypothetical protein